MQTVVIGLRGDRLTVSIAGQPEYQLEPDLGGEFYLKEVGVTLRFLTDAKGEVTAAVN